jgi:hypothetical protein
MREKLKTYTLRFIGISLFLVIISAFVIDELRIHELEEELEYQEITIKNQNQIRNTNDSLAFECKVKDIIILKLKSPDDGPVKLQN